MIRLGLLFIASFSVRCLTGGDTIKSADSITRRSADFRSDPLQDTSLYHQSSVPVEGIYLNQEIYRAEAGVGCDPQNNVSRFLSTYLKLAALDEHVYREGFSKESEDRYIRFRLNNRNADKESDLAIFNVAKAYLDDEWIPNRFGIDMERHNLRLLDTYFLRVQREVRLQFCVKASNLNRGHYLHTALANINESVRLAYFIFCTETYNFVRVRIPEKTAFVSKYCPDLCLGNPCVASAKVFESQIGHQTGERVASQSCSAPFALFRGQYRCECPNSRYTWNRFAHTCTYNNCRDGCDLNQSRNCSLSVNGSVECDCEWPYSPRDGCRSLIDPCRDRIHRRENSSDILSGDELCDTTSPNCQCRAATDSFTQYTCECAKMLSTSDYQSISDTRIVAGIGALIGGFFVLSIILLCFITWLLVRRQRVRANDMAHDERRSRQLLPELPAQWNSNSKRFSRRSIPRVHSAAEGLEDNVEVCATSGDKRRNRNRPTDEISMRRTTSEQIWTCESSGSFRDSSLPHTSRLSLNTLDNASLESFRSRLNRMLRQSEQSFQVPLAADAVSDGERISTIPPNMSRAPFNLIFGNQSAAQWLPKATNFGSNAVGAGRATSAQRTDTLRTGLHPHQWHDMSVYSNNSNEEEEAHH